MAVICQIKSDHSNKFAILPSETQSDRDVSHERLTQVQKSVSLSAAGD